MSEFKKREIRLLGGLTAYVENEEEEAEFADALWQIARKNGPWTTSFLRAWAEGIGTEIKVSEFAFCLFAKAEFIPGESLAGIRHWNKEYLERIYEDDKEVRRELERRMPHYIETSEGVIWIGN